METEVGNTGMLLDALEQLAPHNHLCLIYETEQERLAAIVPFMQIGLARGERCLYIADDNAVGTVADAMRAGAIDVDAAVRSGALSILPKEQAYLRNGHFDADAMLELLADAARSADSDGFTALRATGEMTWALRGEAGSERLIEYEAKLNRLFPTINARAICQYDRRRFPPELLMDVIRTHPSVIYGGTVCRNYFYVPPDEFLTADPPARRVDRMLHDIRSRERTEAELRSANERLSLIAKVAATVVGSASLADQAKDLAAQVRMIFGADACVIRVLEGDELALLANVGIPPEMVHPRIPIGWGISEEILHRRRRIFIADVRTHPTTAPVVDRLPHSYHFVSYAGVPLLVHDLPIGIVGIYWEKGCRDFSETELQQLQSLADHIAVSIANEDLLKQVASQRDQLEADVAERERAVAERDAIAGLASRLAASASVQDIIEVVWQESERLLDWDCYYLILRDERGKTYRTPTYVDIVNGRKQAFPGDPWPERPQPALAPVLAGRPLLINRDSDGEEPHLEPFGSGRRSASLMFMPIRSGEAVIGVVSVQSYTRHRYNEAHLRVLQRIADIVAPALKRAYAEEARRESEERYRRITRAVTDYVYHVHLEQGGITKTTHEPACVAVTGYTVEEFEADPDLWIRMVPAEDQDAVLRHAAWASAGEAPEPLEHRIIRKDGVLRWVQNTVVPQYDEHRNLLSYDGLIRDVTERKQAEDALIRSESVYRAAIENADGVPYERDLTANRYTFMGTGVEAIFGISAKKVLPRELVSMIQEVIITDPAGPRDPEAYAQAFCRGEIARYRGDCRIRLPDGTGKWISDCAVPIRDSESGRVVGSLGILLDITDRKKAEQMLRESRAWYQSLFEDSPTALWVEDLSAVREYLLRLRVSGVTDMRAHLEQHADVVRECLSKVSVIDVNRAVLTLLKAATKEQILGNPAAVFTEEALAGFRESLIAVSEGRALSDFEAPLWTLTGEEVRVLIRWATAPGHEATLDLVFVSVIDTTRLRRAEEHLRESEARYRHLVELSPDAIFVQSEGRFTFINRAGLKLFAADRPEDILGRRVLDLMHPNYRDIVAARAATLRDVREAAPLIEEQYLRLDGSVVDVEVAAAPFVYQGKPGAQVMVRDITQRKQADQELARYRDHLEELVGQRTRELEESAERLQLAERLASIGTLAAGIAHEINNPVGMILLAAENAVKLRGSADADVLVYRALDKIIANAKRCSQIVRSVLQFARQEPTEKWPSDLGVIATHAVELTSHYAQECGAAVSLVLACDLPRILANPLGIEQVLVNLIRNAIESGDQGVRVEVCTERAGRKVRALVRDNGRGMTAEQSNRLFDPFYTTRQRKGGTGLGLSISHGIITEHGGAIAVQSEPGRGTTVTIEFPCHASSS